MPVALPPAINVTQLLTDALMDAGVVGIDEAIEDPMLNRAFRAANNLIAEWNRSRYMLFYLRTYGVVSTGAESYTVGVGQQFDTGQSRPDRIEYAVLRQNSSAGPNSGPFDWPLEVITAAENYQAIRLKQLGTFSRAIFLETSWPIGYIKPWPIPQAGIYEVRVTFKELLTLFPSLQFQLAFPPEYQSALQYGLAKRFRSNYQLPPDQVLDQMAAQSKGAIRLANVQVPVLSSAGYPSSGHSAYNYRSDTP